MLPLMFPNMRSLSYKGIEIVCLQSTTVNLQRADRHHLWLCCWQRVGLSILYNAHRFVAIRNCYATA